MYVSICLCLRVCVYMCIYIYMYMLITNCVITSGGLTQAES